MREGELARIRDRVVGVARVDVLHRVGGARRGLDPLQGGSDRSLHALQYPLLGTPGAHREPRRLELQRLARLHVPALIDHQLRDARVGRGRRARAAPVRRVGERGRGDVGAAGGELRLHGRLVGERVDRELDAKARGVGAHELELEPLGALRAEVITGRQVQRDDAQLAPRADLIECARRVGLPAARERAKQRDGGAERECAHRPSPGHAGFPLEYQPLDARAEPERYRSGHNGADSKSDGRVKPARGFESHPLRHEHTIQRTAYGEGFFRKSRYAAANASTNVCGRWSAGISMRLR